MDNWTQTVKPLVFITCLIPFGALVYRLLAGTGLADPVEEVTAVTGEWGLRFLLITLAVTPLRRITGIQGLMKFRRMLGLFCFFYVCLHFLTYLVLDQFFNWPEIIRDITERKYIVVGFSAWILLIPLAVTSTQNMQKRLGGVRWKKLHSLVYLIAMLAILHFLWLVKTDITEPLVYAVVLGLLLVMRLFFKRGKHLSTRKV